MKLLATPLSSRSSRFHWLWLLSRDSGARVGALIIVFVAVMGLLGPHLTSVDPLKADPFMRILPPSHDHWLGTDTLGRDVFTRMLFGARVSLVVGFGTTVATVLVGGLVGLVAGYFKAADGVLMRVMDGLMAFPSVMLAITIVAVRGPGVGNVILAMTVSGSPRIARLVRGQVLSIRGRLYVEAARSLGASPQRILSRHILPNTMPVLIVQASFTFAIAVVIEAAMSFLGAGVPPQMPAWGNMLQEGARLVQVAPWVSIFPGLAIAITVLGLNLLGDSLRDCLDPQITER
jgi:peptide/nickel transport system permease protein